MTPVSVGIDPSANATGVVVVDAEGEPYLNRLITPKVTGVARLVYIRDALNELLGDLPRLKIGVREGYSYASVHQAFLLAEVGGITQLALHDHADQVHECAPTALKKFATGTATANKAAVMAAVRRRWGHTYTDDNLADAYVLAQVGLCLLNSAGTTARHQLEVVHAIASPKKVKKAPFKVSRTVL